MTESEVIELMKSSKSSKEWNSNADIVKSRCGGYPSFWYRAIILSGIAQEVTATWGSDAEIHVSVL